jgi:hypothetical protein
MIRVTFLIVTINYFQGTHYVNYVDCQMGQCSPFHTVNPEQLGLLSDTKLVRCIQGQDIHRVGCFLTKQIDEVSQLSCERHN